MRLNEEYLSDILSLINFKQSLFIILLFKCRIIQWQQIYVLKERNVFSRLNVGPRIIAGFK